MNQIQASEQFLAMSETLITAEEQEISSAPNESMITAQEGLNDSNPKDNGNKAESSKEKQSSPSPFEDYYGTLIHQQNMLEDSVRTSTYHRAIMDNQVDFKGKVVMDVGAGSGILSFFAAMAGAKKVYAVEASRIAKHALLISQFNGLNDVVEVVQEKLEDTTIPEKVDIIVSEPIGFMLFHERMLETYVRSRSLYLKPGGNMYPHEGTMFVSAITCDSLHAEQLTKARFWDNPNFYGLNVSSLGQQARNEYFGQAIVGLIPPNSIISEDRVKHTVDFLTVDEHELLKFEVPLRFTISTTSILHGLGCWFDIHFSGSGASIKLSTAPDMQTTHWYQCRLLFANPIAVNATQVVSGVMRFNVNKRFSYDVEVELALENTTISTSQLYNLADQHYQYWQENLNWGNSY